MRDMQPRTRSAPPLPRRAPRKSIPTAPEFLSAPAARTAALRASRRRQKATDPRNDRSPADPSALAIIHHLPHQPRCRHRLTVIAHGHDSCILHRGDFRKRFAFASHGSRANRPHANARRLPRPAPRSLASPTRCRSPARVFGMQQTAVNPPRAAARLRSGLDRFGHFLARLAQMAVQDR